MIGLLLHQTTLLLLLGYSKNDGRNTRARESK